MHMFPNTTTPHSAPLLLLLRRLDSLALVLVHGYDYVAHQHDVGHDCGCGAGVGGVACAGVSTCPFITLLIIDNRTPFAKGLEAFWVNGNGNGRGSGRGGEGEGLPSNTQFSVRK